MDSNATLALSAAQVAADPADPTSWAGLAKSIGSALGLFGGGAGYAQNKGIRLTGTLNPQGFNGSAYTITTAGNNPFDQGAFNSTVGEQISSKWGGWVAKNFGNVSIPIDLTSPTADWSSVFDTLTNYLNNGLAKKNQMADASTIPAPDLTGSPTPAGTPIANFGASSGGSSTVAPSPTPTASNAAPSINAAGFAGLPAWAVYLLIAYAAYHLWKGAGRG